MLARFDQAVPGSAERIIAMAEGHARDTWATNQTARTLATRSVIFAFVLAMTALIGGFYLISIDKNGLGFAAIVTALAGPITALIASRMGGKKNKE